MRRGLCSLHPVARPRRPARRRVVPAVLLASIAALAPAAAAQPVPQPNAELPIYAPQQHDPYDGRFILSAGRVYMVGRLDDPPGWDHLDADASHVHAVDGTVEIDVDERRNTGTFVARLRVPEGDLVVTLERVHEFNPCQDGGIAAFLYEHGDSGCGDANWPKSLLYVAGWGYGQATLDGRPLHEDYELHFMVTQGMRDRETLRVHQRPADAGPGAGAVNPAAQQLDFYLRSPQSDDRNTPGRAVFLHFFAMEVTWK